MADFEVVLKRGTIHDGTGGPPLRADVGLRSGRIASIGADLSGDEELDCSDLCVAPGFIDTHAHSDLLALAAEPTLEAKVRQGVTLDVVGQDGLGAAPLRIGDVASRRDQLALLLGNPDVDWTWRSVASYFDALDQARPVLDLACLVPHGAIRESIMGLAERTAAPHDVFRMKGLLARSLDEGAWGLSLGFHHPPGCWACANELLELAGVAASRHVPVFAHLRTETDQVLEAVEELVRLGREAGAHVHISHLKLSGERAWSQLPQLLQSIEAAQQAGVQLTADVYPYTTAHVMLAALLPAWAREGGRDAAVARLSDARERERIRAHLFAPGSVWNACGPENVLLWSLPSGRADLAGKDLAAAAQGSGRDPIDFALDLLREERLGVAALCRSQDEAVMERLLALRYVNVSSGGLPSARPHPRAYGAFPRVLAHLVRDRQSLTLPQAVRKMTGLPADTLGLGDFGYVVEGKRANLVVFDPATVADLATLEDPARFPEGIRFVLVGGKLVVREGRLTGERPGRVARRKRS